MGVRAWIGSFVERRVRDVIYVYVLGGTQRCNINVGSQSVD